MVAQAALFEGVLGVLGSSSSLGPHFGIPGCVAVL